MGISADAFWLHFGIGAAFQVVSLVTLRAGRPFVAWTCQFGAGHGLLLAGLAAERFPILLVAGLLHIPLLLIPARRLPRSPAALLGAAACVLGLGLLGRFALAWDDPETRGRPMVQDRWTSSSPLRVPGDTVVIKPGWRRGRICDWGMEVRFDWTVPGGSGPFDVHLENAGSVESWSVEEGSAELRGGERSRMRVRLAFPPSGGTCRLRQKPTSGATRLLLIGGVRGDLDALAEILEQVEDSPPDGIVLLGDMVFPGDYIGLLAVRDLVDGLGVRVVYAPGRAERPSDDRTGFDVLFRGRSMRDRAALIGGVSAILLDLSEGTVAQDRLTAVSMRQLFGIGSPAVFSHHALAAPADRADALLVDQATRKLLLDRLGQWKAGLAAACVAGEHFVHDQDGVRHIGVGVRDDDIDAAVVTVEGGRATDIRWMSAKRDAHRGSRTLTWRRLCAFSEEHPRCGQDAALGFAGVLGALIAFTGVLARRRDQEANR